MPVNRQAIALYRIMSCRERIWEVEVDRRSFIKNATSLCATSAFLGDLRGQETGNVYRPNVIWLLADQWRAQAVGTNGDPNVHTPNIDRLSATGINFEQARSGFPLCCPFRGTMLTGRYPNHMVLGHEYALPAGQKTIAGIFNDAGYHTGYFGKWHLDGFHENGGPEGRAAMHIVPPDRRGGFAKWVGYENNNSPWDSWVHGGVGKNAFQYKLPKYETDALTDLFIAHLHDRASDKDANSHRPFFAVLSVQPPHNPYVAPAEQMGHYNAEQLVLRKNVPPIPGIEEQARQELAGYYAQIENWDANVGRVVDCLSNLGLLSTTHIMVFSDHGDMHGSHGLFLKENPYEEAVRIPMIISGEQPMYNQRITGRPQTLFSATDIAPTTLGLCGLNAPEWMEGHDYSGHRLHFRPRPAEPDSVYLQDVVPSMHPDSIDAPYRGVVTNDGWKYVCFEKRSWLMFNLKEDPLELSNLAFNETYRNQRLRLIGRLKQWVTDAKDDFAVPDV
jgi:arylsulfatase A-like enzyme